MQLHSTIDKSVNFIEKALEGFLESRYVRKVDDYFICYLSSQTGCNQGCRFCHLTATKQTKPADSLIPDYCAQAREVLRHYLKEKAPAKYMHYNFMARGEPLATSTMLESGDEVFKSLRAITDIYAPDLGIKFNVSTILPRTLNKPLTSVFKAFHPTLYYSMYSVNEDFRKKWLPSAMPLDDALPLLKDYQDFSKKILKVHHCLIQGENDSIDDAKQLSHILDFYGITYEFNLVRYNPFSEVQGKESSEDVISKYLSALYDSSNKITKIKVIPRVGFDVNASCGMFIQN